MVKLPNKLKDYLKDPTLFTLGSFDEVIGTINGPGRVENPESAPSLGKRTGFDMLMRLDIPVKRQKVTETVSVDFDVIFPEFQVRSLPSYRDYALETNLVSETVKGSLKLPVLTEVTMRPRALKNPEALIAADIPIEIKKGCIHIEEFDQPIMAPGFLALTDEPTGG